MKLSACMIAKNEERCIARCINSYRKAVDEIIVIDTGSTDGTREIAKKLGAQVFDFPWQDDFALAKNQALAKATGDWALLLDADEYFEKNGAQKLRAFLEKIDMDPAVDAVRIRQYNLNPEGGAEAYTPVVRAVRCRPGIRFKGAIHEYLQKDGAPLQAAQAPPGQITLLHDGYAGALSRAKAQRNTAILKKMIAGGDDDPMLLFYLGQSALGLQDNAAALRYNEEFLQKEPQPTANTLRALLRCERALRMLRPVLEDYPARRVALAEEAQSRFPHHPTAFLLAANACFELGEFAKALPLYEEAVERFAAAPQEEEASETLQKDFYPTARLRIGRCRQQGGDTAGAMQAYTDLLLENPDDQNALCGYLQCSAGADARQTAALLLQWQQNAKRPQIYLQAARAWRCDLVYLVLFDRHAETHKERDQYFTTMQVLLGQTEAAVDAVTEKLAWHPLWCGGFEALAAMLAPDEKAVLEEMLAEAVAGALMTGAALLLERLTALSPPALDAAIRLCLGREVARFGAGGRALLPLVGQRLAALGAAGDVQGLWAQVLALANGEAE